MKKVLALVFDGVEEMELVVTVDILRRGGVFVSLVSVGEAEWVTGRNGIRIQADKPLSQLSDENFDLLFLPGGPGTAEVKRNAAVLDLVRGYDRSEKILASICAGPTVLAAAGVTLGRTLTSFPATREELLPSVGNYSESRVVVDGRLITSRGAGCAEEFAFRILEALEGASAVKAQKQAIVSGLPL